MCPPHTSALVIDEAFQVHLQLDTTGYWRLVIWWRGLDQEWVSMRHERYESLSWDEMLHVLYQLVDEKVTTTQLLAARQPELEFDDSDPF